MNLSARSILLSLVSTTIIFCGCSKKEEPLKVVTIDKIQELKGLADTIDVSGALETNKVKDINKIKRFITEVKKTSHAN